MTAKEFVEQMDDPDNVGQSEYRILHQFLSEVAAGDGRDTDVGLDVLDASLDEVIEWANALKKNIKKAQR